MKLREPLNAWTHLAGMILSLLGVVPLLRRALPHGTVATLSAVVFLLGLFLLYGTSGWYHGHMGSEKSIRTLRRLDHSMIYVLIAASYTPICLVALADRTGTVLLACIWACAAGGIALKWTRLSAPRWLYTTLYLLMGWAALIVIYPLSRVLPAAALGLLILGGVSYSVGAFIYAKKSQRIRIGPLGFHEIFHLFILTGSLLHFLMIYRFVY